MRYPLLLNIIEKVKKITLKFLLHNYPEHIFLDLMMANSNSNVNVFDLCLTEKKAMQE